MADESPATSRAPSAYNPQEPLPMDDITATEHAEALDSVPSTMDDYYVRSNALGFALQHHGASDTSPDEVVKTAKRFYAFLKFTGA